MLVQAGHTCRQRGAALFFKLTWHTFTSWVVKVRFTQPRHDSLEHLIESHSPFSLPAVRVRIQYFTLILSRVHCAVYKAPQALLLHQ